MFKRIFWGITFIIFAILLTLSSFGVTINIFNAIPLWKIFLTVMFLYWSVEQIVKKHFSQAIFPIVFIFMVLEDEFAALLQIKGGDIAPWWGFLLVGALLTIGVSMLTKNSKFIIIPGDDYKTFFKINKNERKQDGKISSNTTYIDCSIKENQPLNEHIENNIGSHSIYFVNTEAYVGNGTLNVDNDIGAVTIYIPNNWIIINKVDNSLGVVKIPKPENSENKKVLYLTGDNNLGSITVQYAESEEK